MKNKIIQWLIIKLVKVFNKGDIMTVGHNKKVKSIYPHRYGNTIIGLVFMHEEEYSSFKELRLDKNGVAGFEQLPSIG